MATVDTGSRKPRSAIGYEIPRNSCCRRYSTKQQRANQNLGNSSGTGQSANLSGKLFAVSCFCSSILTRGRGYSYILFVKNRCLIHIFDLIFPEPVCLFPEQGKKKFLGGHLPVYMSTVTPPGILTQTVLYRVSHKKGIDKKLLFGAAQGFNSQFLDLFGFSISVSFVWCII